ncbi:MAG: hypothetical protein WC453_01570 [Patescibacteria group bacterium]
MDTAGAQDNLQTAIIKMIAFFDLFDYPLTLYEIREHLDRRYGWLEIRAAAESAGGTLDQQNGFYFLTGRAGVVTTRQKRYNYTRRKLKIARRFSALFRLFPPVRLIALANSLGQYNWRDESDIDFFIVTAPGYLWLTRLYCTGLAKLLHSRPTPQRKRDKICLSFYLSAAHLDISDLRLTGDDPYFDYWRRCLIVLYNKRNTYADFLAANGLVPDEPAPGVRPVVPAHRRRSGLESWARWWQLKVMPPALTAAMNNSDGVVVNDEVLKFYQGDRRREYAEKYGQKIQPLIKAGA